VGQASTGTGSRGRGIAAAAVAIAVVVAALVLSRLDLANEVAAVRSQLTAANQEVAENDRELDQLEDEARARSEDVAACREAAELGQQVLASLQVLDRGLERGDQGTLARGVAGVLRLEEQWSAANQRCVEATQEAAEG
jgi:septal ring factor EnvC (AmiA/AmiB activator)